MANARTRFWTATILASAVWLLALIYGGPESGWDEELRRTLYADRNRVLGRNAAFFTLLGDGVILSALTVAAAIYLFYHRKIRAGLLLLIVFGGRLLVELQKIIVNRDRPGADEHLEAVYSMSFPSGHSANAMITYMAIALLVPVKQRNRAISVGIGLALALQAGWSRIALGVHWPSDVVGGWAFGLLWLTVCIRLASARGGEGEPSAAAS